MKLTRSSTSFRLVALAARVLPRQDAALHRSTSLRTTIKRRSMLEEKEEDVANLKKLFVEKLRELESSFVELSQDMIETEVV